MKQYFDYYDEIVENLPHGICDELSIGEPDEKGIMAVSGTVDHVMSGYMETFNEVEIERGTIQIMDDGTLEISGKMHSITGPASESDSGLIRNYKWAENGESKDFFYRAKDAVDLGVYFEELPQ